MRVARGTNSASFCGGDQAAVPDQRAARALEMVLLLGGRGVEQERRRLDGEVRRGLQQGVLGAVRVSLLQQRAGIQREDVARRGRAGCHTLQRFARLAQEGAVVAGPLQPDLTERAVDQRVVRVAFQGGAERQDREVPVAGARMGQADGHVALDVVAIEARQDLQLLQLVAVAAGAGVDVGELLACRDHPRRDCDGLLEGAGGFRRAAFVAKAQAEQVVDVRDLVVEAHGLCDGGQCTVHVAVAVAGQSQLMEHACRALVELQTPLVGFRGAIVPLKLVLDVAQLFERTGGGRVERRGRSKVARGGVKVFTIAEAAIRLAAAEIREHGVGPQVNKPRCRPRWPRRSGRRAGPRRRG